MKKENVKLLAYGIIILALLAFLNIYFFTPYGETKELYKTSVIPICSDFCRLHNLSYANVDVLDKNMQANDYSTLECECNMNRTCLSSSYGDYCSVNDTQIFELVLERRMSP